MSSAIENMYATLAKTDFEAEDGEVFCSFINYYFSTGRPPGLAAIGEAIVPRLSEFFALLSFDHLIGLGHNFFLFVRTNNPSGNTDKHQQYICDNILTPFKSELINRRRSLPSATMAFSPNPNKVLFLVRKAAAHTNYAPAKQTFTVVQSLLDMKKQVKLISQGEVDQTFLELAEENHNLEILGASNMLPSVLLQELVQQIQSFQPGSIFTDQEIGILNALELDDMMVPVIFFSAGFYRLPWFSEVIITKENLTKQNADIKKIRVIPQTLNPTLLAPPELDYASSWIKNKLQTTENFVFASFARYEKFSREFLELVSEILERSTNTKLILAGPNDNSLAHNVLSKMVNRRRAFLLGPVPVENFGYCCDAFIDTFPTTTGFAALESMTKGKPVLTLKCKNLGGFAENRLPECLFDQPQDLVDYALEIASNNREYKKIAKATQIFSQKWTSDNELRAALWEITEGCNGTNSKKQAS